MPSLLSHLQRHGQDFYGRTFEDNYEMPPNERLEAACRAAGAGDIEAVREWLASADDVNALNLAEPAFGVAGRYGRNSSMLIFSFARANLFLFTLFNLKIDRLCPIGAILRFVSARCRLPF